MADFLDMVGQYARNRMDQATMPFTDPQAYATQRFNNAFPTAETEEERRKRLEREAAARGNTEVQSTQIKTYADGSQEEIIKKQLPPETPVTPVAPLQQTPVQQAPVQQAPAQPVAPSTFDRMIQAESGGRQFAPNGQILTSPKGALGQAQILPSTAKNPGYGIEPATPEEIATPEGNRAFGERYYQGLLKHFEGDERKAIAAYNAGPGRVERNVQANRGQLNEAQLPKETQDYLQKVQGPVAPQQAQTQPMIAGTASSDVALTPTEQAIQQQRAAWSSDFEKAQNDTTALYAIAGNKDRYPDSVRQLAKDRARELELDEQKRNAAEKTAIGAVSGDPKATNDLMRAIKTKSEEGNYLKAYLFSRLGLNELAVEEQKKLAGPKFAQVVADGKQYFVQTKGGAIVGAYTDNGAQITDDKALARINASFLSPTQSETGADIYYNPMVSNSARFALVKTPTGATLREVGTGRPATPQEQAGLVKMSSAGPIEQQAAAAYAKSGAGQQGKQAAEEGVSQGVLPPRVTTGAPQGGEPQVGQAPAAAPAASVTSTATIPNPNQPVVGTGGPGGYAERKSGREIAGKRTEAFNKIIDTEYREAAGNGDVIVENRKKQYDILNRIDPATNKGMAETISGLYNAANQNPGDKKLTIIRDIFTGKVVPEKEISERIAKLNIGPAAESALQEFNALNAQIAGRTLRETAGPGAVSDAEQAANRARNVDIANAPMLGAYNMMGQSQFSGDIQRYKADLAATTNAPNATVFDRDFRKTQTELVKAYREVTEARLDFINKNGGANNPAAIREGYKKYPVPEYDVSTGNWKYLKPLDKIFK